MKRRIALVLAAAMTLGMTLSASAATELKWGSVNPETTLREQAMSRAIEEINENAEDIHITGYYDSTLGGSQDLVEGIQEGMVDFITEGPAQFQSWVPKLGMLEAPYLWQSVDYMVITLNGEYMDELNKEFESVGVHILGTLYYGTRQLTTNKEIKTVDDLKGMKIRVPETDLYVKMVESWGASAAPMNINELYMALQTGTVDGQENPLPTIEAQKFYEVVKYITLTNHIICPSMMFVNLDVWNGLSDHDKEVVQTAVDNAIAWENEEVLKSEEELKTKMADEYGCTVSEPDDSIREATIAAIQPMVEDWDVIQSYAE